MSFISDLFSVFSGSSANTDRKQTLAGYGDLSNVFNFGMDTGKAGVATGGTTEKSALAQLSSPADYYQKLLSGNRQAVTQAVAPVSNNANAAVDAQKRGIAASGTARGGGVNAVGQQLDTSKMAATDNAINQAKEGAAGGATKVAGETASIGRTQLDAALQELGLAKGAAQDLTTDSISSRIDSDKLHQQKSQQAASIASGVLDLIFQ